MRKPVALLSLRSFSAIVQAGLVLLAVGGRDARAANIEIDGQIVAGTPTWVLNGNKALGVTVNPGDTVTWKALGGMHGVVFPTQAEAEAFLTFQTGGSLPASRRSSCRAKTSGVTRRSPRGLCWPRRP